MDEQGYLKYNHLFTEKDNSPALLRKSGSGFFKPSGFE